MKTSDYAEVASAIFDGLEFASALWAVNKGNTIDPKTLDALHQRGAAAAQALQNVLGKKSEQKNEALFATLVDQLDSWRRDAIQELIQYPQMKPFVDDFRYIIPLMAQIKGDAAAIATLVDITDQPSVADMFARARDKGLIEPEQLTWDEFMDVMDTVGQWIFDNFPAWYAKFEEDLKVVEAQLDTADGALNKVISILWRGPQRP